MTTVGGWTGLDAQLAARVSSDPTSLVSIARQGRLVLADRGALVRLQLSGLDESVLALVGSAIERGQSVGILYPAPAGNVGVLLAAQLLIHKLLRGVALKSIGLLTADPVATARAWEGLYVRSPGQRVPLTSVFPVARCSPDGDPGVRHGFQGIVIGSRMAKWPVDTIVVDHLGGPVEGEPGIPTVELVADPLDSVLDRLQSGGTPIWGWSPELLGGLVTEGGLSEQSTVTPFSVAGERLATMATGIAVDIRIVAEEEVETCIKRLREDLHTLSTLLGRLPTGNVLHGLRVAWRHVRTLCALPCRPSAFDRFAGVPPWAPRPISSFTVEVAAWARTLSGEAAEYASIIASDLDDLRTALERSDPFLPQLRAAAEEPEERLVIVGTRAAGRALMAELGGAPNDERHGRLRVCAMRRLREQGSWPQAIVVGAPATWDWHRLDSGLAARLEVLVAGTAEAKRCERDVVALDAARRHWGAPAMRARAWSAVIGGSAPHEELVTGQSRPRISIVAPRDEPRVEDPFDAFQGLLESRPLSFDEDEPSDVLATESRHGTWEAEVEAVEVTTSGGLILLAVRRLIDVRDGDMVSECRGEDLRPGMRLLLSRSGGRVGLLEAIAGRLGHGRQDLVVGHLLVQTFRDRAMANFRESHKTYVSLYRELRSLGFAKTIQALRNYLDSDGPLAPRDRIDLGYLNDGLKLGMSTQRLSETHAAAVRIRTFKRQVGRALAAAARGSASATDLTRVDPETGLSIADLRDLVAEVEVQSVRRLEKPVAVAQLGQILEAG